MHVRGPALSIRCTCVCVGFCLGQCGEQCCACACACVEHQVHMSCVLYAPAGAREVLEYAQASVEEPGSCTVCVAVLKPNTNLLEVGWGGLCACAVPGLICVFVSISHLCFERFLGLC